MPVCTRSCQTASHLHPSPNYPLVAPTCQAIDLLDEAGSRVRIASYTARKAAGGREGLEAANTSYLELEQVLATKAEAVQVRQGTARRAGVVPRFKGSAAVVHACPPPSCTLQPASCANPAALQTIHSSALPLRPHRILCLRRRPCCASASWSSRRG